MTVFACWSCLDARAGTTVNSRCLEMGEKRKEEKGKEGWGVGGGVKHVENERDSDEENNSVRRRETERNGEATERTERREGSV